MALLLWVLIIVGLSLCKHSYFKYFSDYQGDIVSHNYVGQDNCYITILITILFNHEAYFMILKDTYMARVLTRRVLSVLECFSTVDDLPQNVGAVVDSGRDESEFQQEEESDGWRRVPVYMELS